MAGLLLASCYRIPARQTYTFSDTSSDTLTERVHVLIEPFDQKPDLDRVYHYFHNGQVRTTQGAFEGRILHGTFSAFDLQNELREKGNFRYGLKHGPWLTWHPDGTLQSDYRYKHGWRQGPFTEFDPTGRLIKKGHYKHDKLNRKIYFYSLPGEAAFVVRYKKGEIIPQKTKKVKEPKAPKADKKSKKAPKEKEPKAEKPGREKRPKPDKEQPVKKEKTPKAKKPKGKSSEPALE